MSIIQFDLISSVVARGRAGIESRGARVYRRQQRPALLSLCDPVFVLSLSLSLSCHGMAMEAMKRMLRTGSGS